MGGANEERELGLIAEQALASRERSAFRGHLLDLLDRAVGFDKASLQSYPRLGDHAVRGYDRVGEFANLPLYMSEFEPTEIAAASSGRPFIDVDALSGVRRDRLSLYHRFLRPERVTVFISAMWRDQHGVSGVAIARTGRGARFTPRELDTIDRLLPTVRLADSFVGARQHDSEPPSLAAWADDTGLTPRERAVVDLLVWGT